MISEVSGQGGGEGGSLKVKVSLSSNFQERATSSSIILDKNFLFQCHSKLKFKTGA